MRPKSLYSTIYIEKKTEYLLLYFKKFSYVMTLVQFISPHSIRNLIQEENLICDKVLEALDVIKECYLFVLNGGSQHFLMFLLTSCSAFSKLQFYNKKIKSLKNSMFLKINFYIFPIVANYYFFNSWHT